LIALPDRPVRVSTVDLAVGAPLAPTPAERAVVEADFARRLSANPTLWNGPFYLFDAVAVADDALRARARPTDFATFMLWRAAAEPDPRFAHMFPVPAVTTADGRLLVGLMGPQTANPGRVYPPSGSFDPLDEVDGRLDPVANMLREVMEEVGLDIADLPADPGFTLHSNGPHRLAIVRRFRAPVTSAEWSAAIAAHVAEDPHQELAGFRFLAFDERLPDGIAAPYVAPLLADLAADR
jgi:8-oxo-dGTP pyrophosphatase MutT (NUDIX family)